jgi:L-asparagine transporter-like permease
VYPKVSGLAPELKMVQLSATKCSCVAILWVILVSFAAITLCVASQRVFVVIVVVVVVVVVVVYFFIDPVRKIFDTHPTSNKTK